MVVKYIPGFLCLAACLFLAASAQEIKTTGITVHYPEVPLLKRSDQNPLVCLKLFVSEPGGNETVQSIRAAINADAFRQFSHLVIYANGNEPAFDENAAAVYFVPVAGTTAIPVNIPLKQGWNYIWIGASLKESADMDAAPSVEILGVSGTGGKQYQVAGTTGNAVRRIGIVIRKAGEDHVHTYRIPGIARTDKGTLIAVYDNRYQSSQDLPGNIDIGMSRSTDGGKTWEPMKVILDMGEPHENNGIGDPTVLFDPATKTIWVAGLWSKGNRAIAGSEPGLSPEESGQFVLVSSRDDGLTWSEPYNITAQVKNPKWHIYFNGPGSGIVMADGTLVFPSQYWDESKKPGMPHSSIVYSKDHGKTWHSGTGAKRNTTESQVVETTPGTLMLNMRDNRGFFRSVATTTDLGKTWREHPTSYNALPDPVCMAGIIKAGVLVKGEKKDVLFFSNVNMSSVEHSRKNMTVKASLDLGETWQPAHQLLLDERYCYGYSSLTRIDEKTIGILYEGQGDLYFLRIPVASVIR